ncbi:tumor necrosis factor-like [Heptranchias perlo]|uniref:tumor necrosis factor-like n=1 Tax=Heptranchias perlo TaxID=212740 RepID=UPI003559FC10
MSNESMLSDVEAGEGLVEKQTDAKSSRLCQTLTVITILGLVTFSSYLLLCQLGVLSSNQKAAVTVEPVQAQSVGDVPSLSVNPGLPRLMNVVGRAPKKIAVHLTASPTTRGKRKVMWQKKGVLPEGVGFRDNSLVIKTPGLYFVYTQVVFYSRGCQDQSIFLSHELAKLSTSYRSKVTLLSAMKSACHAGRHDDPWYRASYQGAVFEFAEGDKIFARVGANTAHYVNTEEGKSYFGLFAL